MFILLWVAGKKTGCDRMSRSMPQPSCVVQAVSVLRTPWRLLFHGQLSFWNFGYPLPLLQSGVDGGRLRDMTILLSHHPLHQKRRSVLRLVLGSYRQNHVLAATYSLSQLIIP